MIYLVPSELLHPHCLIRPQPLNIPQTWTGLDPDVEQSDSFDVYMYLCVSISKLRVHGLEELIL